MSTYYYKIQSKDDEKLFCVFEVTENFKYRLVVHANSVYTVPGEWAEINENDKSIGNDFIYDILTYNEYVLEMI